MGMRAFSVLTFTTIAFTGVSFAECELDTDQLEDLVGYEVESVKSVAGWVDEAEYHVRRGETLTVFEEDFVSVSYEDTAAKGDLDRQAGQGGRSRDRELRPGDGERRRQQQDENE